MNVCVTGGTGFIGRALVNRLLAGGVGVRVLARPSQRADALETQGAEVIRGSLMDTDAARAFAGADVVYHAAAKVDGPGGEKTYFEANVRGTEQVLKACLAAEVKRVVYVSSIAVYGPIQSARPIDENTPSDDAPEQRDLYAQSKIAADRLAIEFAQNTGLAVTILRPGIVFGPDRALPIGLLGARLGNIGIVVGSRRQRIPLTYVENLIDAMEMAAAEEGRVPRQYIVIDDEDLTLGEYHAARDEMEKTRTLFVSPQPFALAAKWKLLPRAGALSRRQVLRALEDRKYDTRRIREQLSWIPQVNLREAMRRTVAASG
ncbi:MAG TPA: NAD-dependent epimerase/dehydratase family protein [Candidatus Acidoferrales bacterium]|jgi:nucleoside-diphosphate-sugar epimerase|nr:NAD-dependent epimerase/dehydratase family protein [Candidatus Acidoferrales bacterium]